MSSSSTETLIDVNMPQMGVSVAEGTVVEWKKQVGETVDVGTVMARIATDARPGEAHASEDVPETGTGEATAALEATADLDGASVEVLDLRSLVPLDEEAILDSVRRCSKVVIVDEANMTCAAGAQVAALIAERGFESLDGPVVRVSTPDVPIPFSPPLEQAVLPSVERVREACRELLEY